MSLHTLPLPRERSRRRASILDDETLRAALTDVEARMRRLSAGDRLERAGVMAQEHLSTGGRRVRARLALAATVNLGGDPARAVAWAVAVELLHNATLVHDDIQDGDRVRRGHPTTWVRHGVPQAINAGDLMLMLPFVALQDPAVPPVVQAALSGALARSAVCIVRGQAEEMDMLMAGHLSRVAWERCARGKTGALFGLPVEGAALAADRTPAEATALGRPFAELGLLYQLQDDVVDLYGDKGRGERGSDLKEGKVSALVAAHLERWPEDRAWLVGLLSADRAETTDAMVADAARRFQASGALDAVLDQIRACERRVMDDPALAADPALLPVADELAQLALRPIRHLLSR
jgi:geranylgeranyl pyrophosphate synthase